MRQSFVIANWKLNGSLALVDEMVNALRNNSSSATLVICPPAVLLPALAKATQGTHIQTGAQNSSEHSQGAYTGEISATMLAEAGAAFTLVGHSERRAMFHEDNQMVAAKVKAVQSAGMTAVLCVGETLQERDAGRTLEVVKEQLQAVLEDVNFSQLVIAYEPVWAIGTGKTATPEQAQQVHREIRQYVATFNAEAANKLAILYGGSVKPDNAAVLFAQQDIDGGLIGGASLQAEQFSAISSAVKG